VAGVEGRIHDLIHILVLESLAYLDQFELDQAVDLLAEALALSEPGGYVRVYLDEGNPMLRLLRIAHRRGTNVPYVEELLATAGETPGALTRVTHMELVEPITPREVDVLRLIALGLTNKEIGDELYVSVATVKRHITNLNGKLGVSSRTEAVQKARRLKLLPASGVPVRRTMTESDID
jgi:LuxR family maltose regulon positive regulatory protein